MKKSFLFLCTMLCSLAMNAQLVSSHSSLMTKAPSKTTWMVRLGVGSNNFAGDSYEDIDSKVGYFFGFEFNKNLGKRGGYWGMDLALASRGYSYEYGSVDVKLAAHNFQWSPFIFGWKISVPNSKFSIDPHIGVFASVDYAGKQKFDDSRYDDIKIGDLNGYQRFDAGLKVGVGCWYNNKYNIDLTYQRGFVANFEDGEGGQSNFMVRLGYAF